MVPSWKEHACVEGSTRKLSTHVRRHRPMCLRKDAVLERLNSIVWILQDSLTYCKSFEIYCTKINILLRPKSYDMSQWILRAPWSARWAKLLSKFNSDHNFGQCFAAVDLDQLCAVHGYRVCLSNVPGPSLQKKRQDSRCQNQRVAVSITSHHMSRPKV